MEKRSVLLIAFVIGAVLADAYLIGVNFYLGQVKPPSASTSTTIIYWSSGTLSSYQQQQNARSYGLNLSSNYFYCDSGSSCEKVQIATCNNNLPAQSACINPGYYQDYYSQWKNITNHAFVCPLFIVAGNVTCSCDLQSGTCVEQYSSR